MEKPRKKTLGTLFLGVCAVSAFTFGGGFVIVTFLKKKFVDELHWIDEGEMLDYIALAQSAPGSIAVNAAILLGWNALGFPGMLISVLGAVLPPMVIIALLSLCYAAFAQNRIVALLLKGMQAGVAAVIMDAAVTLGTNVVKEKNVPRLFTMAAAFVLSFVFKVNVVFLILSALLIGFIQALIQRKKARP